MVWEGNTVGEFEWRPGGGYSVRSPLPGVWPLHTYFEVVHWSD
jgi:hypothetical protein